MKGQVAIPETSDELEELLNDNGRLTDILKEGQFSDFTQAYIKAALRANGGVWKFDDDFIVVS